MYENESLEFAALKLIWLLIRQEGQSSFHEPNSTREVGGAVVVYVIPNLQEVIKRVDLCEAGGLDLEVNSGEPN